jgi:hypothetical protein
MIAARMGKMILEYQRLSIQVCTCIYSVECYRMALSVKRIQLRYFTCPSVLTSMLYCNVLANQSVGTPIDENLKFLSIEFLKEIAVI